MHKKRWNLFTSHTISYVIKSFTEFSVFANVIECSAAFHARECTVKCQIGQIRRSSAHEWRLLLFQFSCPFIASIIEMLSHIVIKLVTLLKSFADEKHCCRTNAHHEITFPAWKQLIPFAGFRKPIESFQCLGKCSINCEKMKI